MTHEKIDIKTPFIKLDSLLKFCGESETGGTAKEIISGGKVSVDGEVCIQRGKKLYPGMIITVGEKEYEIG